jgi:hypothetical protein
MKMRSAKAEITLCNILEVEVSTNCPQGGDGGHGGKTELRFKDLAGTCMDLKVDRVSAVEEMSGIREVSLIFGGDSEAETLAQALEFAAKTLRCLLAQEYIDPKGMN